jgi:hypothetical protein
MLAFFEGGISARSEELTGEEILKRSEEAQHNFYSYTRTTKKDGIFVQTACYSKSLPEGILKWTIHTSKSANSNHDEPSQSINIIDGYEKFYWYYPDHNLAVDISYQIKIIQKNAEAEKKRRKGAMINFDPVAEIRYDGFDCYDIKTTTIKESKTIAENHYIISSL